MAASLKRNKPQRMGKYELEDNEETHYDLPPEKRTKSRKHFPMKVNYKSTRDEEYIDITNQIQQVKTTDISDSELEE